MRELQSRKNRQAPKVGLIALMSFVMVGAASQLASQTAAIGSPLPERLIMAQVNQPRPMTTRLPVQVAQKVRRDLAQRFNLTLRDLKIVQSSRETWPDSCLGLAAPNERCAMATVEGWRIELTNGQQNWIYRTDLRAQVIKLETRDTAELPPPVVDRLFETIAREARVPANTLKVVESQPRTWDGCMGIYAPGRACTRIAIAGYRVIVMGDRQSWVYHVSEDGSRIAQNTTASGTKAPITPAFLPEDAQPANPGANIVFQMTVTGGLDGSMTETVLTSEGILYRRNTSMRSSANSQPTILKRLSQRQVQQFQQQLQQQRFPNLNGMKYVTSAVLADYPTTFVQAMGSTVAYIDLEQPSLPKSLQNVIQAWQRL